MAVTRPSFPDDHYTRVPNAWLRDPHLPPAPKAYLAYLLSHAVGYACSTSQAARDLGVNRSTVTGWNSKLVERGYFIAVEQGRSSGRFGENDYTITSCTATAPPLPAVPGNRAPVEREGAQSTVTVAPRTVAPSRSGRHIEEQEREDQERKTTPAAAATGGEGQLTLVEQGPTLGQRAQAIAREHHDAVGGLAPFMGVVNVVRRALQATAPGGGNYSDEQVRQALGALRERGRPVTLQTIGAVLTGHDSVGARSYGAPYRDAPPDEYRGAF